MFALESVTLEGELSLAEIQVAAGKKLRKIRSAFKDFQNIWKKLAYNKKVSARPKQAALKDTFSI